MDQEATEALALGQKWPWQMRHQYLCPRLHCTVGLPINPISEDFAKQIWGGEG